ncbi:hypothetical protein BJ165DRAFT_1491955 [Panaeolus papilionaceus]|nr:hypothetical protein BJ165DRAFT_1491955 [Panaeolus papilionaceus]
MSGNAAAHINRTTEPLSPTQLSIYISTGTVASMKEAQNLATIMLNLLGEQPIRNAELINDLLEISANIEFFIWNYGVATQEENAASIDRLLTRTTRFLDIVAERSQSTPSMLNIVLPPTAPETTLLQELTPRSPTPEEMRLDASPPAATSVKSLFVGTQLRPQPQAEVLPHRTLAIPIAGRNYRDLYIDQDSSVSTNPSSVRTRAKHTDSFGMSQMSLGNDQPESVRDPVLPWTEKVQLSQSYLPNAPFSTPPGLNESKSPPAPLPPLETLFQYLTFAVDDTSDLVDPPVAGPSQPARNKFYVPEDSEKASTESSSPLYEEYEGKGKGKDIASERE